MKKPAATIDVAKVREYAALQFSLLEVEALLGLDRGDIAGSADAAAAYLQARLTAAAVARRTLFEGAKTDRQSAEKFLALAGENMPEMG